MTRQMVEYRLKLGVVFAACLLSPIAAWAGPPFLTDDPEPTEPGHWEIYAPLVDAEGRGGAFEGAAGVEINYGAGRDVQVTVELPAAYKHENTRTSWGAGDVAASVKYRFYHDEKRGLSAAVFPGVTLPTATNGMGAGRVTGFLPVWVQKDAGAWSVFGGGGYAINPGGGNRNFWTGAMAVSREVTRNLTVGLEAERKGADTDDGASATSLGLGAIYRLRAPVRLLASAGPTFEDESGPTGFHAFLAIGLDY